MESQWLTYAKRLKAPAATGLYYSKDAFDQERYREIADIANEMLAKLGDMSWHIDAIAGVVHPVTAIVVRLTWPTGSRDAATIGSGEDGENGLP